MNYSELSELIFDYLYERNIGSEYFIMTFDENDLNQICIKTSLSKDDLLNILKDSFKQGNAYKNQNNKNWPFGIAAIQIFCATKMGDNNSYTDREYNPILAEMIGINIADLQILYRSFQDDLWKQVKEFIIELGYQTNIPEPSQGSGRYVKYPKSQSYFNHADLISFNQLFVENPQIFPRMEVGKDSFFHILCRGDLSTKASFPNSLTARAINLIKDPTTQQEILKAQVFNYYCKLEEFQYDASQATSKMGSSTQLFFDYTKGYYTLDGKNVTKIENISEIKSFLVQNNVINSRTTFLILKRDPGYGDYFQVLKANLGDVIKILLFDVNSLINICIQLLNPQISLSNYKITIYDFKIPQSLPEEHCLFKHLVNSKHEVPITWKTGVKLDRTSYLKGFGPKYYVNYKTTVFIDSKPFDYNENDIIDLSNLDQGYHTIQPMNGRKISFTILEPHFIESPSISSSGWDLHTLSCSDSEVDVYGLKLFELRKSNVFSTRNFIDISMGKKLDSSTSNQLFKTLSK